jgi:hypothetical protein
MDFGKFLGLHCFNSSDSCPSGEDLSCHHFFFFKLLKIAKDKLLYTEMLLRLFSWLTFIIVGTFGLHLLELG